MNPQVLAELWYGFSVVFIFGLFGAIASLLGAPSWAVFCMAVLLAAVCLR
jgi:hypothetical protein